MIGGMPQAVTPTKRAVHPLRDALIAALVTFATSAVGLVILYLSARDAQLQAVRGELLQLARAMASQVDGDLHATLVSPAQDGSPEHLRALAPLARMHAATEDVVDVYTGIIRDGRVYWILDSNYGKPASDENEPADPIMSEYLGDDLELREALTRKIAIANAQPVNETLHTYLSAFAPFYDSAGKFAGVLGVDMILDALDERMASIGHVFLMALAAVLALSLGAGTVALRMRMGAARAVKKLRVARAQAEASAAAAEAATQAKADFLAMMSHEIRTPMNGMLGVADLLRSMSPEPKQKKLIDILTASGHALLRIINDILDFSKMEAEKLELRPKPFALAGLLDELQHLLSAHARAKQVRLAVDADANLPVGVNGDRQRLSQVLLNLGSNAVKFTDGGEVRLIVRVLQVVNGKARLEFSVRDTGIGMDAESMGRLFTPFTQLAESSRHRGGGTGLGLVIAQKLVNMMGGRIRVQSEKGRGSVFTFAIEMPPAELASSTTTTMALRLDSLSVLVAEDNTVNQTIIDAMLRQLGHRVTIATNGKEALAALADQDFDLVLMDYNMPEMDGLEATRRLRSSGGRNQRITVIALTANAMDGDRDTCIAAGMDDFLPKPVTIAALRKAIDDARARGGEPAWAAG